MTESTSTAAAFPEPRMIGVGDVTLAVHECGTGPAVILVHGFPELAFSWRHQLPALAAAGYRAIAPDMRGYGGSDKPDGVKHYTIQKLVGDLTGLMDALELEQAAFVAHDWGALVAWQMALMAPQRMAALAALNIPFFKRPPLSPVKLMRWSLGDDFYIVNFQDSDEADRRFGADPARFIDVLMRRRLRSTRPSSKRSLTQRLLGKRRGLSLLDLLDADEPGGEPVLSREELAVFVAAFEAGGFTAPINWYRNFDHNWRSTRGLRQTVTVPTLFVGGGQEVVVSPRQIEAMKANVSDLEIHMFEDCGHWTQQEQPERLNELLIDWFGRRYRSMNAG